MIHYIKGRITERMPGMICIESNGIGYEVNVPDNAISVLPGSDEIATVYTALIVREDDMSLYGFSGKEDLAMFRMLLSVSGIGPKAALSILSVLGARELKKAIIFEDVAAISRANGVGKKSAQRVVMDLKDKVGLPEDLPETVTPEALNVNNDAKNDAVSALMALGFSRTEAMSSIIGISGEDLTTEDYIKQALRQRR